MIFFTRKTVTTTQPNTEISNSLTFKGVGVGVGAEGGPLNAACSSRLSLQGDEKWKPYQEIRLSLYKTVSFTTSLKEQCTVGYSPLHFCISTYFVLGGGEESDLTEMTSLHFKAISYVN